MEVLCRLDWGSGAENGRIAQGVSSESSSLNRTESEVRTTKRG